VSVFSVGRERNKLGGPCGSVGEDLGEVQTEKKKGVKVRKDIGLLGLK